MNKYKNLSASGLIKTGAGAIIGVVVNSHTTGTMKLWDSLTATGAVITNTYSFPTGSSVNYFGEGIGFGTGLFATIVGVADITIIYK